MSLGDYREDKHESLRDQAYILYIKFHMQVYFKYINLLSYVIPWIIYILVRMTIEG